MSDFLSALPATLTEKTCLQYTHTQGLIFNSLLKGKKVNITTHKAQRGDSGKRREKRREKRRLFSDFTLTRETKRKVKCVASECNRIAWRLFSLPPSLSTLFLKSVGITCGHLIESSVPRAQTCTSSACGYS